MASPTKLSEHPVAALRALVSDLTARASLAGVAGLTFGGKRDLYQALGYSRTITYKEYRDRYARGDISARIVDAYPKATWAGGAELVEDEDPDIDTAFEEDFSSLSERLQLWTVLQRADTLAGLGAFAVVVIGAKGKTEEELPRMSSPDDILYLAPYGPEEVSVDTWVDDTQDPRYGLPSFYSIRRVTREQTQGRNQTTKSFRVHWTRAVHVADGMLDDRVNGTPRLEKIWNRLDDLDKVIGGGSEAFWQRVHRGTVFNVDKDVKVEQAQIDKLKQEAEELLHGFRRTIAARGFEVQELGGDVSNFNQQVLAILSVISGATGIPQRILLGSERGELASTQDKENWNERVAARRGEYGTPLVRSFADRMIDFGAVAEPTEYNVRWPEIAALTEVEQASVATAWAGLNTRAQGAVVLPEEIRDRILGLDKLTPEQLAEFDAQHQPVANPDGSVPGKVGPDGQPVPVKPPATPPPPAVDENGDPIPPDTSLEPPPE